MTNEDAYDYIDDYIDGLLEDEQRVAFEACLERDAALAEEVSALKELRRQVGEIPRNVQPARDLWPEIRLQIDERESVVDFARKRAARPRYPVLRYVMAAAALVLVVFGLSVMVEMQTTPQGVSPITGQVSDPELNRIEEQYMVAREELMEALRARRESFEPETLEIVEANLAIIESAVVDINLALSVQPEDPELERMLHAAYRSEVDLLQQAVKLADES